MPYIHLESETGNVGCLNRMPSFLADSQISCTNLVFSTAIEYASCQLRRFCTYIESWMLQHFSGLLRKISTRGSQTAERFLRNCSRRPRSCGAGTRERLSERQTACTQGVLTLSIVSTLTSHAASTLRQMEALLERRRFTSVFWARI